MNFSKYIIGFAVAISLVACGGGGGNATAPSGGTGTGTGTGTTDVVDSTPVPVPTLTLELFDGRGVATSSVSASDIVSAKATLKDAAGAVVANEKVTFLGDLELIKISPASIVLSNSEGVATVQLSASSLSSAGAGTLSVSASIGGELMDASINFQLSPANLTLATLDVGAGSLEAYGNRPVSALANINGVLATKVPVRVTFTASCGVFNPSTAVTDSAGKAATTYTADSASCAGTNVRIMANSVGVVTPLEGVIAVSTVQATNLQFVSANPTSIYLLDSGSVTQSQVSFKVVDSIGNPVQNQKVNLSLLNPNLSAGLSIDTLGNSAGVVKTTDVAGLVTVAVFSGNVPTSVQVTAKLDSPSTVKTNSNILTVASGKAVQKAASLSLEKFSIEGFSVDGVTTNVTFSMADRQGNPVPDGTEVNFVAESGVLLPARCVVEGGTSQCSSTYRTSGTRPANGRVSILAYVPGEENFIDANFNNKYDFGEKFTDMGNAYRDDDENSAFTVGEFSVPRAGTYSCPVVLDVVENGRPMTCDKVWGLNEVRKSAVIVVATGEAIITTLSSSAKNDLVVTVADKNGNSMPTGTLISAEKQSGRDDCAVKATSPGIIVNRYGPQQVRIEVDKCDGPTAKIPGTPAVEGPPAVEAVPAIPAYPADKIRVTVTSPDGIITVKTISVTP